MHIVIELGHLDREGGRVVERDLHLDLQGKRRNGNRQHLDLHIRDKGLCDTRKNNALIETFDDTAD